MKLWMVFLLAATLLISTAHAEQVWSFGQVMQAAMASHPLVLGKRSAQDAAKADQEGAEWQRYPTLSLEMNKQRSLETNTQLGVTSGSVFVVEQPLWSGGRITADIGAAGSRFDAAGAALGEARQELALKVIAAITEALRQKARQQHGITDVREHEKLLAMIQRRVVQEVSPMADQRLAESRLYASVNELSLTTQALSNALAQLSQLAGQPVREVNDLGLSEATAPASLDAALAEAQEYSPTLLRLKFEEEAADADIDSKRSAYYPKLALRLGKSAGQVSDTSAMLVLTAQPGAGLSSISGTDAAIAKREATRMAREAAGRDMRERLTQDWNEWVAARLRLENANQARNTSTEVFESYARQYTTGRKTWIDVLNAMRETTLAEQAAVDAHTQMLAASLRLRALSGTLTIAP